MTFKFAVTAAVVILATGAGYLARRARMAPERLGEWVMTWVAVAGYPAVGFLCVWGTHLKAGDAVLPVMGAVHSVVMIFLALWLARWVTPDARERSLFALAGGVGNNGFTMGAFVLYLLYGEPGMALANVYILLFMPVVVLVMYPLARRHSGARPQESLARLVLRNLLDWRSIGLPAVVAAMALSALEVPRPAWIASWRVVDILVYVFTPLAFFGIGLRLHLSRVLPLWRMIGGLALVRFPLAALAAVALAAATRWTPWPIEELRWNVYVIEGFVPSSVTMVAVANMFDLHPREASVLFVANTAMYLVLVLPVILRIFGGG